jgi:predicted O-methyltransferase YrrM
MASGISLRPWEMLSLLGVTAAALGVVVVALDLQAGLIVLAIALAFGLAGLAWGVRVASRRLEAVEQGTERARKAAAAARQRSTRAVRLAEQGAQIAETNAFRFRTSLDTLPSDILRLERATERLAPSASTLPGLGDWAVTPATLLTMLDEVLALDHSVTVVECGSGSSTVFLALALRERGDGGRVVSLESDPDYAEETRQQLRAHGVETLASVVDAPLTDVVVGGESRWWFDTSGVPELSAIDVLFVDGPVGGSSHHARYPAFPVFSDRLAAGALVILDDTDRPHERAILTQWLSEEHAGRRLRRHRKNVRSTFLRVEA